MKSKENRIGLKTLNLPYEPDITSNLYNGKIEGKPKNSETEPVKKQRQESLIKGKVS